MPMQFPKALAVCALLVGAGALLRPAAAQDALPAGPGRDMTFKVCSECHGVELFQSVRRPRLLWENTITNMIAAGMTISDADFETVADYLATYLGPAPPPTP